MSESCQRALTVRNNVVIDVEACRNDPGNVAVEAANQIAGKVDKQQGRQLTEAVAVAVVGIPVAIGIGGSKSQSPSAVYLLAVVMHTDGGVRSSGRGGPTIGSLYMAS